MVPLAILLGTEAKLVVIGEYLLAAGSDSLKLFVFYFFVEIIVFVYYVVMFDD